jgi:hypothetical protein
MDDRDEKGRFVKGVSGNPGGKPLDQTKYLKKIDTTMSLKEWRAIVLKAIEQAKRGDPKARQWLSDYLLGKPTQRQEITGAEGTRFVINLSWDDDASE